MVHGLSFKLISVMTFGLEQILVRLIERMCIKRIYGTYCSPFAILDFLLTLFSSNFVVFGII